MSRDPNAHLFKKVWSALQRPDFLAKAMDRVANLGKVAGATDGGPASLREAAVIQERVGIPLPTKRFRLRSLPGWQARVLHGP